MTTVAIIVLGAFLRVVAIRITWLVLEIMVQIAEIVLFLAERVVLLIAALLIIWIVVAAGLRVLHQPAVTINTTPSTEVIPAEEKALRGHFLVQRTAVEP